METKMNKVVIFQEPEVIKNRKIHNIVLGLLVFIITPIFNILVISSGEQSALYNSLSRLAWPEKLLWLIYIWGLVNSATFIYSSILVSKAAGYTKTWKRLFVIIALCSLLLMTVGISIPSYADRGEYYEKLRTIHTAISCVGFFGHYIVILIMIGTLWTKYKKQALVLSVLAGFTLIFGVFSLTSVYDPTSYCTISAPAQILIFCLFHVDVGITYYLFSMDNKPTQKVEE